MSGKLMRDIINIMEAKFTPDKSPILPYFDALIKNVASYKEALKIILNELIRQNLVPENYDAINIAKAELNKIWKGPIPEGKILENILLIVESELYNTACLVESNIEWTKLTGSEIRKKMKELGIGDKWYPGITPDEVADILALNRDK
jgi:hypothetical protein